MTRERYDMQDKLHKKGDNSKFEVTRIMNLVQLMHQPKRSFTIKKKSKGTLIRYGPNKNFILMPEFFY